MRILITGSAGLIGGQAVEYFGAQGHEIVGIDNFRRAAFFGPEADPHWNLHRVAHKVKNYTHHESDICDGPVWRPEGTPSSNDGNDALTYHVFKGQPFDAVIHCAAQPSLEYAEQNQETDYLVNSHGTQNLLYATKKHSPNALFVFVSGIHQLAVESLVEDYVNAVIVRPGCCVTGAGQSGCEQHGIVSYLLKCAIHGKPFRVHDHHLTFDVLDAYDLVRAIDSIVKDSSLHNIYVVGGGRSNATSVEELVSKVESLTGLKVNVEQVGRSLGYEYVSDIVNFSWGDEPRSVDDILEHMLRQHYWGDSSEDIETRSYAFDKDSLVLDVGGYRGAFTADMLSLYGCKVHLFEPVKEFADACRYRFRDDRRVTVHHCGLAGRNKKRGLAVDGPGTSYYKDGEVYEAVELRDVKEVLDEQFGESPIDLVSLNCEGGEFEIIERLLDSGAISRIRNLQVQFHKLFPDAEQRRDELRARLRQTHCERFCAPWLWESWAKQRWVHSSP